MPGVERPPTAARTTRLAALTPDQIEHRPFGIEDRGYDRDEVRKFLAEAAATLRLAQRSTLPPLLVPRSGDPATAFDRVPAEVSRILRAAELSAQARRDEADAFVDAIVERAEHDAEQVRRQAEDEAAAETERARRVLLAAQAQALAIVADAEQRATTMLDAAREHARQHARRIAGEAQKRADEVSDAEAAALLRLNEARLDLVNAIDSLARTRTHTVLDITGAEAELHIERRDADDRSPVLDLTGPTPDPPPARRGDGTARPSVAGPVAVTADDADDRADALPVLHLVADDEAAPTRALIRRAVERASAAASADPAPDLDATGAALARVAPVRPSVQRRHAQKGGDARPCPTAVAPGRPAERATPTRRTDG